ncbi:MAG TPA: hypothetical protein VFZ00_33600 [Solirubrobacter sp.]|nr:hypothetical protein [Solirubrobacter sp.]
MAEATHSDQLEARLADDEARLADDELRLTRDEQRLYADEARLEVDEAEIRESRIVGWMGIGLAIVLSVAIAALVLAVIAVQDDVGLISRAAPDGSVATSSLRDGSVTAEKLAANSVWEWAIADGAVGAEKLAADAITGRHVARNSLTGRDIVERTLATVPSARDAARLGDVPAHSYVSRLFEVSASSPTDASELKGPVVAGCPRGSRVVSGGAAIQGAIRGAALVENGPVGDSAWTATGRVVRSPAPSWRLVVTVICGVGGD